MTNLENEENKELYYSIFLLLLRKGLKSMTMDSVAASLGISKRTLYEIFDSKMDMVVKTMTYISKLRREVSEKIFMSAPNALVAAVQMFYIQRDFLCKVNGSFFLDMDRLFPEIKEFYISEARDEVQFIRQRFQKGVDEGLFRSDVDYLMKLKMLSIQMESLKRMEDKFPSEVTLVTIIDSVYSSFLSSIVSDKGKEYLKQCKDNKELILKDIEKYLYKDETNN